MWSVAINAGDRHDDERGRGIGRDAAGEAEQGRRDPFGRRHAVHLDPMQALGHQAGARHAGTVAQASKKGAAGRHVCARQGGGVIRQVTGRKGLHKHARTLAAAP